jgi:hypothetical protein
MIPSMQRNSTQHVIDRFKEKFYGTISFKDKEPFLLTKEDYDNIHLICKDDTIGHNLQMSPREKGRASAYKKIIFYRDIPMWVVFTTAKRKPKTIFPVRKTMISKLKSKLK